MQSEQYGNPWGASNIDYNYLGPTGAVRTVGNGFWRFLFEPFITFEEPRRKGTQSLWRGAKKLLISYTLEAVGVLLLVMVVAGAVAGAFKAALNPALIAIVAGVTHGLMRLAITGWRHTPYLPRNLSPTVTWVRVFHGTYGVVWALIETGVQYGFAAIASAILCALTLAQGDEWRGGGKFGFAADLSDVAAWALYSLGLFGVAFIELYNQTITSKRYPYDSRHNHANRLVTFFIIAYTALSTHWGIYSNNEMIAFGGGLAAGNLTSIGSIKWLILLIFGPLMAIALTVFLKWLLWNNSDIPAEDVEAEKNQHRLKGVTGADGGVPHQMEERREVSNQMAPSTGSHVDDLLMAGKKKRRGNKKRQ